MCDLAQVQPSLALALPSVLPYNVYCVGHSASLAVGQPGETMNVAVDASVIIAVVANEPTRDVLIASTSGYELVAPYSVHWEIGNAFSAMLKRRRVTLEQALRAVSAYCAIPITFLDVDMSQSLRVAAEHGIYAYDAYLVQCALQYDVSMISLDAGLVSAARQAGVRVLEVAR